jgi:hypothetical protein
LRAIHMPTPEYQRGHGTQELRFQRKYRASVQDSSRHKKTGLAKNWRSRFVLSLLQVAIRGSPADYLAGAAGAAALEVRFLGAGFAALAGAEALVFGDFLAAGAAFFAGAAAFVFVDFLAAGAAFFAGAAALVLVDFLAGAADFVAGFFDAAIVCGSFRDRARVGRWFSLWAHSKKGKNPPKKIEQSGIQALLARFAALVTPCLSGSAGSCLIRWKSRPGAESLR